jgi:hypothetical protein
LKTNNYASTFHSILAHLGDEPPTKTAVFFDSLVVPKDWDSGGYEILDLSALQPQPDPAAAAPVPRETRRMAGTCKYSDHMQTVAYDCLHINCPTNLPASDIRQPGRLPECSSLSECQPALSEGAAGRTDPASQTAFIIVRQAQSRIRHCRKPAHCESSVRLWFPVCRKGLPARRR